MGKGENDERCCCCEPIRYPYKCMVKVIVCFLIPLVLVLPVLGIAEIVIGAIYIHDCSLERMVPIYLIVSGCGELLLLILLVIQVCLDYGPELTCRTKCSIIWCMIGGLFTLAWLICGTVWVYPTYGAVNKDTYVPCHDVNGTRGPPECTEGTCNDSLLKSSVAMVTLDWICIMMWSVGIGIVVIKCRVERPIRENEAEIFRLQAAFSQSK